MASGPPPDQDPKPRHPLAALPPRAGPVAASEAGLAEPQVGVVLVDDHQMFAESLARLLADEPGVRVLGVAGTATAGLALARREHPAVVLVDYHLPDEDGVVLTRRLRDCEPDANVVMLTGVLDDKVLLEAIDAGCSGFLTKDRAAAEVVDAVRSAAAGEALVAPQMLARLLSRIGRSDRPRGSDLTEREREILARMAYGLSNRAIAQELYLSVNTVRNYAQSILTKLGAHSKLEAVSLALRAGLVSYSSGPPSTAS